MLYLYISEFFFHCFISLFCSLITFCMIELYKESFLSFLLENYFTLIIELELYEGIVVYGLEDIEILVFNLQIQLSLIIFFLIFCMNFIFFLLPALSITSIIFYLQSLLYMYISLCLFIIIMNKFGIYLFIYLRDWLIFEDLGFFYNFLIIDYIIFIKNCFYYYVSFLFILFSLYYIILKFCILKDIKNLRIFTFYYLFLLIIFFVIYFKDYNFFYFLGFLFFYRELLFFKKIY